VTLPPPEIALLCQNTLRACGRGCSVADQRCHLTWSRVEAPTATTADNSPGVSTIPTPLRQEIFSGASYPLVVPTTVDAPGTLPGSTTLADGCRSRSAALQQALRDGHDLLPSAVVAPAQVVGADSVPIRIASWQWPPLTSCCRHLHDRISDLPSGVYQWAADLARTGEVRDQIGDQRLCLVAHIALDRRPIIS